MYGKFMLALWTFCVITLNDGGATRAGKSSTIANVEGEATFRTVNQVFALRQALHLLCQVQLKEKLLMLKVLRMKPFSELRLSAGNA